MTHTPANEAGELREKLLEIYMEIAESFYYEGSDVLTEREEFGPKTVETILALLQPEIDKAVREAMIGEVSRIPNPAIIAIDGKRKEPMLQYKQERLAQLREGKS